MNEKLPTDDALVVALVVRWTVQAIEMAAVLSGERQWCVIEADCLQVLPWLPDGGVNVCLQDPPYSEHTHTKVRRGGSVHAPDVVETGRTKRAVVSSSVALGFEHVTDELRAAVAGQVARVVGRWSLTFSDQEGAGPWMRANVEAGLEHVRIGQWVKPGAAPQFTGDRPASGAEAVVIAHPPGRKRWNGGGSHAVWNHPIEHAGPERVHTTQKPLSLMLELVGLFTDPGEVMLDPFCGSGTTGVAALRLGRRAILIERDAKYAAIARQRMEAEERGQSLKEYRAGQRTLWEI